MPDPRAARMVLDDLRAESDELDGLVAELSDEGWRRATPAPGWTIAHQISHLAWTDRQSLLAVTDPEAFGREVERALGAVGSYVDEGAEEGVADPPAVLLRRWRDGRAVLQEVLAGQPEGVRFQWFGPPMSTAAMATGRLMETWAHGQDVADALEVRRTPTARLRHVARIGVKTRDFAFLTNGLTPPAEEFRIELTAPDGDLWAFGPPEAGQRVTGPAADFCQLATQRRNRADLSLTARGADADRWLDIAQAFAGPPGAGRAADGTP